LRDQAQEIADAKREVDATRIRTARGSALFVRSGWKGDAAFYQVHVHHLVAVARTLRRHSDCVRVDCAYVPSDAAYRPKRREFASTTL